MPEMYLRSEHRSSPSVLWLYLCFAAAVTLFEIVRVADLVDLTGTVRYTGWMNAFPYMFSIPYSWAILRGDARPSTVTAVAALLVFAAVLGVVDVILFFNVNAHGNPHLYPSTWRPVITIGVPVAWLMALYWNGLFDSTGNRKQRKQTN